MRYAINRRLPVAQGEVKDCRNCVFYRVTDREMTCGLDETPLIPADARWCDAFEPSREAATDA